MNDPKRTVYFASFVAALGGLLFGYDTAVISGGIGFLKEFFDLNPAQEGWAVSSALVGCIIGVAASGFLNDAVGRKKVLLLSAALFTVSAVGSALPRTFAEFVLYRMIGGLGVGAASMTSPLFIAEIAPPAMRGRLVSWNQLAIVFGMLVVYFVNYLIADPLHPEWNVTTGWRWMFGSETLPAALFFLLLFFVPESPRFLIKKGRRKEGEAVLARICGEAEAERMASEIEAAVAKERSSPSELLKPGLRRMLLLGVALAVLQQITGINVIIYYAPEIFKKLGSSTDAALLQTVVIGVCNLAFTLVAINTVDRYGRKPLMLIGAAGMGLSLLAFGMTAFLQISGAGLLIFVLTYIASFALSVGPVTWVILSEIFPTRMRGRVMALCTVMLWGANYLVSQTFPMLDADVFLVRTFHHAFSFWLYALFCVVLFGVVKAWVPETKGKSLEEIERFWGTSTKPLR
ncbi:MAG: sugar porter family MFS transporter [candidate division KSB1 bacterium]|nr:sugar porter family MFS transporter [candidate division KSB1 bacterium]